MLARTHERHALPVSFQPGVHPNVSLVRRVFDALRSGDERVIATLFAEDVATSTHGADGSTTTVVGRAAACALLATDHGSLRTERIVADDRLAVVIQVGDDAATEAEWRVLQLTIADGLVVAVRG